MGYSHVLIPVTRELLDWAQECEVSISSDIPEGWWPTGAFITFLIALPVGLTMGIPYVWGLAIVGIIVSGLGFIMPRQSR